MAEPIKPGKKAVEAKGWLGAQRWLLFRRLSQLSILGLFLAGPLAGIWIVKGNLAFSYTLDILPLTDPYVLLQAMLSGVTPEGKALIGAGIVIAFYALVGGRVYCSWVCPVNMVTDLAGWLRRRLGLQKGSQLSRTSRYWLLAATFVLAATGGGIVWELINPVSMLFRGVVFGLGLAWVVVLGVFLFDLLIARDGWCGKLCPVGAFYSLLGWRSLLRVVAAERGKCDDCMDCFAVCPEAQVIKPALKGAAQGIGPVIESAQCTNCGRCIDVCARNVFRYGSRFSREVENH